MKDRDSRGGTEILYVIALQKHPPLIVKGVDGSEAIAWCTANLSLRLEKRKIVVFKVPARECGVILGVNRLGLLGKLHPCKELPNS